MQHEWNTLCWFGLVVVYEAVFEVCLFNNFDAFRILWMELWNSKNRKLWNIVLNAHAQWNGNDLNGPFVRIFPIHSIYPVNLKKNDCGSCVLVCADKDVRGLSSDKLQKKNLLNGNSLGASLGLAVFRRFSWNVKKRENRKDSSLLGSSIIDWGIEDWGTPFSWKS